MEKDFLADVDPEKGRFRSFLLASLRHYLSHERDRERALKRGGGTTTLSLDVEAGEAGYALRPTEALTPVDVCEREIGCGDLEVGDPIEWQQPRRYQLGLRVEF